MRRSWSTASSFAVIAALGSAGAAPAAVAPGGAAAAPQKPAAGTATIAAAAPRVVFGRSIVLSGQVTGGKAAGAQVSVEHTPAPFTAPFEPVGPPVTADAAGAYSLTVTPAVNTRYRAVAKTKPPATSDPVQVNVAPAVGLRVSDNRVRRGRRVRFHGRVLPAHDGAVARIQRRTSRGFRKVAEVVLRASGTAGESVYSKRLRIRRKGVYRVKLAADADHVAGRSRKRRIAVR